MKPSEQLSENVNTATKVVKEQFDKINPANYNANIKNCFPLITYFFIFIIFCIAFIALYIKNSVLIGISLLYVINAIYTIFLIKDMFSSKRSEQIITIILFAILMLNAISSTFIILTLKSLHTRYNAKNETIKLSRNYRKRISDYFTMFITTIAFTWFLALFYFGEDENENFFNYVFIGKSFSPSLLMIIFILKICTSLAGLGLSAYMVFLGERFIKLKNAQYV
jgi:hypothetical protein